MVIKTFFDNVDLSKLLVGEFQKVGKHLDSLAGRALAEQSKRINSEQEEITELVENIGKSRISLMTMYHGDKIKHQTVTLLKDGV